MDCCIKIVKNSGYLTIASVHSLRSLGQLYGRISLRSKAAPINLPSVRGVSMRRIRRHAGSSLVELYHINEEAKSSNWISLFILFFTFFGSLVGITGEHAVLSGIAAMISGILMFSTIRELFRAVRFKKELLKKK